MIVGNEIHGLKVKHLHVGGVLGSGEVQNGIRGCIQVNPTLQYRWEVDTIRFLFHVRMFLCYQGVRLGVRPDAPPLPRPTRTVKVETGCNVGNPCISSSCPTHSRCSDQWERHACICEPGKVQLF